MERDPPLFAMQRLPSGAWTVRALSDDPRLPAVVTVAVVEAPSNIRNCRRLYARLPPSSRRRVLVRGSIALDVSGCIV